MAGLCSFFIGWPSAYLVGGSGILIRWLLSSDKALGQVVQDAFLLLLMLLLTTYFGIAFGRFLLRAVPPQFSDTHNRRSALARVIIVFVVCVGPTFFRTVQTYEGVLDTMPFVLWCLFSIYPVYIRHKRPRAFLNKPFVLFLRRFSSVSDRAIIELTLRYTPKGQPVVVLTPTQSLPSDWNPLLVAFSGQKVFNPIRSVPIVLRASDEKWQVAARELIHHASLIVFDTTEGGASIDAESCIIADEGREKDTVCVKNVTVSDRSNAEQRIISQGGALIKYEWRWRTAARRLTIGIFALLITPFFIAVFTQTSLYISFTSTGSIVLTAFSLGLSLITATRLYILIFGFPSIDPEARTQLKNALRGR